MKGGPVMATSDTETVAVEAAQQDEKPNEASSEAQSGTVAEDVPSEAQEAQEPHEKGSEAGKYRVRLREAEAERDKLKASLESVRRQMVEERARKDLAKPAVLWALGVTVDSLLTDDGRIDMKKLDQVVKDAIRDYGLASGPEPLKPNSAQGQVGSPRSHAWADAMRVD